jgi:hypothetical protein
MEKKRHHSIEKMKKEKKKDTIQNTITCMIPLIIEFGFSLRRRA